MIIILLCDIGCDSDILKLVLIMHSNCIEVFCISFIICIIMIIILLCVIGCKSDILKLVLIMHSNCIEVFCISFIAL